MSSPPTGPTREQEQAMNAARRLLLRWEREGVLLVVERPAAVVRLANVILELHQS